MSDTDTGASTDRPDEQPDPRANPEPQTVDPENAAFVLLGVAITVGLLLATLLGL